MSIVVRTTGSGEPRYMVRLRGPDGLTRNRTFRTKAAAERYEREQLNDRDRGSWVDPARGRITLAEWVPEWTATVIDLRPSTHRIYAENLRLHILPVIGHHPLNRLSPLILRQWLAQLSKEPGYRGKVLSPASVHQAYRVLRRVLNAAVLDGRLMASPLVGVRAPKVERDEMRILMPDEVATLADTVPPRYRALVLVAAYCGLRSGELIGLRWNRVDLLRKQLSVIEQLDRRGVGEGVASSPKSKAGRRAVAIPSLVVEALQAHLEAGYGQAPPDGCVFAAPKGGPLRPTTFRSDVWVPATKRAGLDGITLHDLRHTCASLAIAAGADVKVLQTMLGHASAGMTLDQYGHLMPGRADDLASRLDEMARGARPANDAPSVDIGRAQSARSRR